jgi:hypothetical protein
MSPFNSRRPRATRPALKRSVGHAFEALEQRTVLSSAPLAVVDSNAVLSGQTLLAGTPPDQPEEVLIAPGSTWRYFATGRSPGATWMQPSFPDATWSAGPAELGYGDGDEATLVPYGPDPLSRYLTTYLRYDFDVADPTSLTTVTLGVLRDDGVIVYLNGTEIARDNVSIAAWWARATADQNDNDSFLQFPVPPELLVSGRNVLAVELHQSSPASSDLSFDLTLSGRPNTEWVSQGVLANDADPDGDVLTAMLAAGPSHGALTLYANGAYAYKPEPGYLGPDTFSYRAYDGISSSTATVTIDVRDEHHRPQVTNDTYRTLVGQTLAVTAARESDPASRLFQSTADSTLPELLNNRNILELPYTSSFTDQIYAVRFEVMEPTHTLSIGAIMRGNSFWFDPPQTGILALVSLTGPEDVPDSLDLSTPDVLGAVVAPLDLQSEIISVPLEVNLTPGWYAVAIGSNHFGAEADWRFPVWRGPSMDYADSQRIGMFSEDNGWAATPYIPHVFVVDTPFQVGVLANDTDADGDTLTARLVEPPAVGTLDFHPDGTFSYVPPPGFEGTTQFHYEVADPWLTSEIATATIEVSASPLVSQVAADAYAVDEDSELVVAAAEGVLSNDIPAELTAELISPPRHGTLTLAADGSFRYQPAANFFGVDRFLYRARQGEVASGPVEVALSVAPQPDAPAAHDDDYRTTVDQPLSAGEGARPASHVYWADTFTRRIRRQNLITGEVEDVLTDLPKFTRVFAVDPVHEMVYLAYDSPHELAVYRAPFRGTPAILYRAINSETCGCSPNISDIALDVAGGHIYFAGFDRGGVPEGWGFVWRANLESAEVVPPWGFSVSPFLTIQPADLFSFRFELDLKAGHVYMADSSAVLRANLDGSELTTILTDRSGLEDIALDVDGGKLYIRRNGIGIERADIDGRGVETFATIEEWDAFAHTMTFDGASRRLIWTPTGYEIASAHRADGIVSTLVGDNLLYVEDLVLDLVYSPNHTFGVLANDRDPDRRALTAILEAGPTHGTVTLESNGTFEYVPEAGFVGVEQFSYRAYDGSAASPPTTVTIRVLGRLPGDANLDGVVDRLDAAVFIPQLGRRFGAQWRDGDFDGDADVDLADFDALQRHLTPAVGAPPSREIAIAHSRIRDASRPRERLVLRATRRAVPHEAERSLPPRVADAAIGSTAHWTLRIPRTSLRIRN